MNDSSTDHFSRRMLEDQLAAMGCQIKGKVCTCPNPQHQDSNPSASILDGDGGHCRVFCHVCVQRWDVYDLRAMASGQELRDVLPRKTQEGRPRSIPAIKKTPLIITQGEVLKYCQKEGVVEKWYPYTRGGVKVLLVARIVRANGKKTFRQCTPLPDGMAAMANLVPDGQIPLYRQDDISADGAILVVEGEKCCDAAWQLGLSAVTSAMGAGKASLSDWSILKGRTVVLWPDNDALGKDHMRDIELILSSLRCRISRVDPDALGLPAKADIADIIDSLSGKEPSDIYEIILEAMGEAEARGPIAELAKWHQDIADGKWLSLPWPLDSLGRLSRCAMPGSITLLCADPASGKSWLMLQLLAFWNDLHHRTVCRMMEDDLRSHMARLLCHLSGNGKHTDDEWIRLNQSTVREDLERYTDVINHLGGLIHAETDEIWNHDKMIEWVENHAKSGARVIMVDPITAVQGDGKPWIDDFAMAMKLKIIARKYGCSIIITTHPRGSAKEPSLSGLAGGTAWTRFAHNVLWLTKNPLQGVTLISGEEVRSNRIMFILKSRHGKGSGCKIALNWTDTCRFTELGIASQQVEEGASKPTADPSAAKYRSARIKSKPSPEEDVF